VPLRIPLELRVSPGGRLPLPKMKDHVSEMPLPRFPVGIELRAALRPVAWPMSKV
jgi:hypothetical protein